MATATSPSILLSDVIVVRDLVSGLSLWNRNGYYCTLVTPEGEVVDPMGIVTGGSGAPSKEAFLAQRRRIREIGLALAELESKLPVEERESEQLKQELERAETKKSLLGTRKFTASTSSACASNTRIGPPLRNMSV